METKMLNEDFRSSLQEWILSEDSASKEEEIYSSLFFERACRQVFRAFCLDMIEKTKARQDTAEDLQLALNKAQQEAAEARRQQEETEKKYTLLSDEFERISKQKKGFERQLVYLQQEKLEIKKEIDRRVESFSDQIAAVAAERDQAWKQFSEREAQLDAIRQELASEKEKNKDVTAQLISACAERDEAWEQFSEREERIGAIREELKKSKEYGAEMATKVGEMEKMLTVRIYRKLHRR